MAQPDVPSIDLDFAFSIRLETGGRVEFEGPMRSRVFEPITGGEVFGSRLSGRVVPQSGADFASNNLMDAHLMLQASDGTWLYMNLFGYEHKVTPDGSPYFRVAPYFDTPAGAWEWLGKTVFIGTAERHPNQLLVHVYALK
ncbi:MAG TPA: DUF3237 family protein [Candidatus Acidoferrum sp.]|nr:DUF3237 family protein [Candidatus Acidoferrum sp.]